MEKGGPHIIISIVSWKYLENVLPMVQTLLAHTDAADPIMVVETGGDRSEALDALARENGRLQIVYATENNGYAAAHALAANRMLAENLHGVLLLNPDLRLEPDHIRRLKAIITQTGNHAVIGAPVFNEADGKLTLEYAGFPVSDEHRNVLLGASLNETGAIHVQQPVGYSVTDIHGCFVYFPTTAVRENGWMHTHYFLYGEENEYLHRLHKAGVNMMVSTDVAVLHENGGTFKRQGEGLALVREYYRTRNRLYNNYLFGGPAALFRFNFGFVLKYALGRYVLRLKNFRQNDLTYHNFLGHLHFLRRIRGKYLNPDNF